MEERRTVIQVTEAAYRLGGTTERWLARILECAREELDQGLGMAAWMFQPVTDGMEPSALVVVEGAKAELAALLMRALKSTGIEHLKEPEVVTSWSAGVDAGHFLPLPPEADCDDALILSTFEPGGGYILAAPSRRSIDVGAAFRRRWQPALTHIRVGARLRQSLSALSGAELSASDVANRTLGIGRPPAGAVAPGSARPKSSAAPQLAFLMNPQQVATGTAKRSDYEPSSARSRLRELARRVDRDAKGAGSPESVGFTPEQLWRGLMAGQWSLIDSFDADGRRHLVIRETPASATDPRGLTLREWQAARAAATGLSNKHIALSLGLSESTVATHLKRALVKLGLKSRMEFATVAAQLDVIPPLSEDTEAPDD